MTDLAKRDWELLAAWRGIAALLVAIGHMVQVFVYPNSVWLAPYSGLLAQASVMIFFVISGCSIAASGFSLVEAKNPVRRYIWHRMARIWPPLVFSMVLTWCLSVIAPLVFPTGNTSFIPAERLARDGFYFEWVRAGICLLFLNGFAGEAVLTNGPLWSLSYEVWLYFIFFFFLIGLRTRFRWLSIASLLVYLMLATLDRTGGALIFAKYSLVWAAGIVVYFVFVSIRDRQRANVLIFPMTLTGLLAFYYARSFVLHDMNEDVWPFNVVFGLFFALFLSMQHDMPFELKRWGGALSKFGYTLYLIHFPIFLFVFGSFQRVINQSWASAWFIGVCALLLSLAVAKASARLLENRRYFLKFARLD